MYLQGSSHSIIDMLRSFNILILEQMKSVDLYIAWY